MIGLIEVTDEDRPLVDDGGAMTLIDLLLAEQQSLTAVERFSQRHATETLPVQSRYYQDLIPIRKPGTGEQYGFAVDLDACSGCKACVTACHSLNGLDEGEAWRDVGLLFGGTVIEPVQQTVTTACHHCADPGCLNGCPVLAYEKDADTGIVRHLDDQCIGCQYCVLKCPYDVPKYNAKRGIVRKCDMCHSRLAGNEAPACVQACPNEAIRIRVVSLTEIQERAETERELVPGAFDSRYTRPSTLFTGKRDDIAMAPGDAHRVKPEHAHSPLGWMLTLTQTAVALQLGALVLLLLAAGSGKIAGVIAAAGALVGLAGVGASIAHLGRPLYAWRAFLGLRRSWLSREIVAFGGWLPLAFASALALLREIPGSLAAGLLAAAVLAGLVSVFCSVMVYVDTRRTFWRWPRTTLRFLGTVLVTSLAAAGGGAAWWRETGEGAIAALAGLLTVVTLAKLAGENLDLPMKSPAARLQDMEKTARLMTGPLWWLRLARNICGFAGGVCLPLIAWGQASPDPAIWLAILLFLFAGEWCERRLFFRAVVAPKMPGGV